MMTLPTIGDDVDEPHQQQQQLLSSLFAAGSLPLLLSTS
jgi:hypothetical protein